MRCVCKKTHWRHTYIKDMMVIKDMKRLCRYR